MMHGKLASHLPSSLRLIGRSNPPNARLQTRQLAITNKKQKQRERQKSFDAKHNISASLGAADSSEAKPDFQSLLRNLYKKSHPDLLRGSNPDIADINDSSMQILNGVLTTIKTSEFPPAIMKKLPFWTKDAKTGQLVCKMLNIQTAGGYSKNQLTACFEQFFESKFTWGKDYWVEKNDDDQNSLTKTTDQTRG